MNPNAEQRIFQTIKWKKRTGFPKKVNCYAFSILIASATDFEETKKREDGFFVA
jgi:hypothetical protein